MKDIIFVLKDLSSSLVSSSEYQLSLRSLGCILKNEPNSDTDFIVCDNKEKALLFRSQFLKAKIISSQELNLIIAQAKNSSLSIAS